MLPRAVLRFLVAAFDFGLVFFFAFSPVRASSAERSDIFDLPGIKPPGLVVIYDTALIYLLTHTHTPTNMLVLVIVAKVPTISPFK